MANSKNELFDLFSEHVLSSENVIEKAISSTLGPSASPDYVKQHFSELLDRIGKTGFDIFLASQEEAWKKAIEAYVPRFLADSPTRRDVVVMVSGRFKELDRFFMSLAQSRKARAGQFFQTTIRTLFKLLDYPFSEQPIVDGKPDFVLPSEEHFRKSPVDCIIFTTKRTIRERWRQIVTEGTRGLGFFLATVDPKVSAPSITEMGKNRIYLVVPNSLKTNVRDYSSTSNVIDFENFFADYLDPAVHRWRKAGLLVQRQVAKNGRSGFG